ncbi:Uncharacterized protein dnm_009150 [Desulfonema magnum]|uniref:Uncharacterized protein n=1 Tax=Desulfonema magnum TaxID=45655 RepID=A0A975GKQ6_9BACT|nr:Uncharacterized protein dnm_009150 [Desulfonema magnum]
MKKFSLKIKRESKPKIFYILPWLIICIFYYILPKDRLMPNFSL